LVFRPVIDGKEGFVAFPRFSISSHANIYDFWPRLMDKCGGGIGDPEDYEIWDEHHKLSGRLAMGLYYEIISKYTPGRPRIPRPRRGSIDLTTAPDPPEVLSPDKSKVPQFRSSWIPGSQPIESRTPPGVRPQWRAQVVYQAQDGPEREWRGFFTDEDTEASLERRARNTLGILGSWRRFSCWRDPLSHGIGP
jgi:hypothetical protein